MNTPPPRSPNRTPPRSRQNSSQVLRDQGYDSDSAQRLIERDRGLFTQNRAAVLTTNRKIKFHNQNHFVCMFVLCYIILMSNVWCWKNVPGRRVGMGYKSVGLLYFFRLTAFCFFTCFYFFTGLYLFLRVFMFLVFFHWFPAPNPFKK